MNNITIYAVFISICFWLCASGALVAVELKDPDTKNEVPPTLVQKMFEFERLMNERNTLTLQLLGYPDLKSIKDLPSGPVDQAKSLAKYVSSKHMKLTLKCVKLRTKDVSEVEWISFYSCVDMETNTPLEKPVAAIWVESKARGWYLSAMSL